MVEFWDELIVTYIECAKKVVGKEMVKHYEIDDIVMRFDKAVEYVLDVKKN